MQRNSGRPPVMTVGADCRLADAPDALLTALRQRLTIDNPRYLAARKYSRWVGKKLPRKLYFFREEAAGDFSFPRGYARQALELCREVVGAGPEIIDRRRAVAPVDIRFRGRLRSYQEEAVRGVLGREFGVLVAGTGSGKTVMALAVAAARRQPVLVLLHSRELMYQWRDRIEEFLGCRAGLVGDGRFELRPVTVAVVNSARRRLRELPHRFGNLVVDECHRVPATLFTEVVSAFDSRFMLGLSATAYRREDGLTRLIYLYMGDRVHRVDTGWLTAIGAVLRPEVVQRETSFRYGYRGNYPALLKALTGNEERNRRIAADVASEIVDSEGTVLVVSDRVEHCRRLAGLLAEQGITAAVLTGRVPAAARREIIEGVRGGRQRVLISTLQLVGEGFDDAGLTTLFLTTPIKFSGRLRQIIGRILRPAAGKQPKVIDYVDPRVGVLRNSARARQRIYESISG